MCKRVTQCFKEGQLQTGLHRDVVQVAPKFTNFYLI